MHDGNPMLDPHAAGSAHNNDMERVYLVAVS